MRFLTALIFSLFISANAMAALSANDWQSQLQGEVTQITKSSPDIHAVGNVAVQDVAGQLKATLPSLSVNSPDGSYWTIPSIVMTGSSSSNAVTITLPSAITRYNADKKEIARLTLGSQNLNGSWSSAGHYFEMLNGTIKNISFDDTIVHAKSTVGNVSVSINKGSPIEFTANDVRSTTQQNQKQLASAVGKVTIVYEMPDASQMTLSRLIGLFNPVILLAEKKEIVFTTTAEQVSMTGSDNRTTTMQKLVTKFDLQPKGKTVSGKINSQAFIVSQTPASAYSFVLPRQVDLVATVTNLPVELVSFAPGMSFSMAKSAMAETGTVINLSKFNMTTFDGGKLTGTGNLKADDAVPAGFVGRVTLNIENLKDIVSANQAQLLQPEKGMDRSAKTQSLMAMMMLQGMGKQNGTNTEFVLDLTADGQTLVNGQDLSGLIPGMKTKQKAIETAPALPITPVTGSNL